MGPDPYRVGTDAAAPACAGSEVLPGSAGSRVSGRESLVEFVGSTASPGPGWPASAPINATVIRPAVLRPAVLVSAAALVSLGLAIALLVWPDYRSAWEQAALTRHLPESNSPDRRGLWTDQLRPLLREADALGPEPDDPAQRLAWRKAQCAINQRLQALQRQFGRPVETAQQMGRPPACEQLGVAS